MPDIETDIDLRANGGDAAAAEIMKASNALDATGASSGRMQEKFQERFQHVGLQLFAGDALRASGLGRETRIIISTLNLALREGATVAGLSSGGLMLVVAALGALAGIAVKVIEHQKSLLENNKKILEADTKELETLRSKIQEMEKYAEAAGHLNQVQQEYLDALRATAAEEAIKKNNDLMDRIGLLNQVIVKEQDHLDSLKEQLVVEERARSSGVEVRTATVAGIQKVTEEIKKNSLALKEAMNDMDALHKTGTGTMKDLTKETEAATKDQDAMWKKYWEDVAKYDEETHKKIEQDLKDEAALVKQVSGQIGGDLGNAFAHSLVEGKKFTDEMKAAFTRMAEQIIADMVKMAVEAAVLGAMGLPMGGALGGAGGLLGKFFGGGFATGGSVMVDQPTMFLAGEGGPEMATFTPMSGMDGSRGGAGGDGVSIGSISMQVTVSGVNDPDAIANQVGRKIIEQIRGAGQLAFVRS